MTALKRRYSALCRAHAEQGREIIRLKALYEPNSTDEASTAIDLTLSESSLQDLESGPLDQVDFPDTPSMPSTESQQPQEDSEGSAEVVLHALISRSDFESTTLLARLRMGEDLHAVADELSSKVVTSEMGLQ